MKNTMMVLAACVAATAFAISGDEMIQLALKDVTDDARSSLAASTVPANKAVAVLPIDGDSDGSARWLVKNAVTAAGRICVEGKEEKLLEEIVKEIEWDERKGDILDAATIDRFGRLKSAQYLVYGELRKSLTERYVLVELELHATEVATKRHVWGGTFVRRLHAPTDDPNGHVEIPVEVRNTMRGKLRERIAASLKKSARIGNVKSVACLPVAGDVDQYVAGLVRDVLSASAVTPVNLDVSTRAEARFALRQSPGKGDAILYGALRDVDAPLKSIDPRQRRTYDAQIEIQLWIEKGATREILWSDTVFASEEFVVGPRTWWDVACGYFPSLRERPWLMIVVPLGALFALTFTLVVAWMTLRAMTRVR